MSKKLSITVAAAALVAFVKKGSGTVKRCATQTVRPGKVVTCKYTATRHANFKAVFVRRDGVRVDSPWMYL